MQENPSTCGVKHQADPSFCCAKKMPTADMPKNPPNWRNVDENLLQKQLKKGNGSPKEADSCHSKGKVVTSENSL